MFNILRKSFGTGVVTECYPHVEPGPEFGSLRGRPEIDFANWKDARPAAAVCPTGAIACVDSGAERTATLDIGACIFCGLCAEVDPAIRMSNRCELAARRAADLRTSVKYELNPDGTHRKLTLMPLVRGIEFGTDAVHRVTAQTEDGDAVERVPTRAGNEPPIEALGCQLQDRIAQTLGRSLHIREVDAGSCNGCEIEIAGLNSPVYDIERFGIHFVASPRHADMLLVTGPVTRNMELALRKTYDAMPEPRLVVAVGACGCSGGMFGRNYATLGGVDKVIPVNVYIPGCPPNPVALIHGILTAVHRLQVAG